jgi:hypothetical protein
MAPPKYENHSTTNKIVEGATYALWLVCQQTYD